MATRSSSSDIARQLLQRRDRRPIERHARPLCRRVVGANRFDGVADELEPNRLVGAGWIEIHDAAAHAELAGFVDWILARIAGLREEVGERRRRDVLARRQRHSPCASADRAAPAEAEAPQPMRPRDARPRTRWRAALWRVPMRCRSAVSARDRDRLRATETAAPRARRPHPTTPRARRGRTARRPSSARLRRRWHDEQQPARGRRPRRRTSPWRARSGPRPGARAAPCRCGRRPS